MIISLLPHSKGRPTKSDEPGAFLIHQVDNQKKDGHVNSAFF